MWAWIMDAGLGACLLTTDQPREDHANDDRIERDDGVHLKALNFCSMLSVRTTTVLVSRSYGLS